MALIPHPDSIHICHYPKHKGEEWIDILLTDPLYVDWLLGMEGPPMAPSLFNYLTALVEADDDFMGRCIEQEEELESTIRYAQVQHLSQAIFGVTVPDDFFD